MRFFLRTKFFAGECTYFQWLIITYKCLGPNELCGIQITCNIHTARIIISETKMAGNALSRNVSVTEEREKVRERERARKIQRTETTCKMHGECVCRHIYSFTICLTSSILRVREKEREPLNALCVCVCVAFVDDFFVDRWMYDTFLLDFE